MNKTGIEWTDYTWNPMTGCYGPGGTKEAPRCCEYCYAREVARNRTKAFPKGFEPVFHDSRLDLPAKEKKPLTVFVGSMTDMMGEWWHDNEIEAVIDVCDASPHHTFLWLTKNPGRYAKFIWPKNCWLGTTVTNQPDANKRVVDLVRIRDVKRFLSIEPMESGIILQGEGEYGDPHRFRSRWFLHGSVGDSPENRGERIHQVILGGQTGKDAVPMHPDWVRSVRDQCAVAGVPFFFKSWGEWQPCEPMADDFPTCGDVSITKWRAGEITQHDWDNYSYSFRVGKKKAGRLLDGREHNDRAWSI